MAVTGVAGRARKPMSAGKSDVPGGGTTPLSRGPVPVVRVKRTRGGA
jgi:hypothetical protein